MNRKIESFFPIIKKDVEEASNQKEPVKVKATNKEKKLKEVQKNDNIKDNNVTIGGKQPAIEKPINNNEFDKFIDGLDSWANLLKEFTNSDKMKKIHNFIEKEYSENVCYPPKSEIFEAFQSTPWKDVKVVIIGQDPYFNKGEAMGLCFSVNKGIKVPPSLNNIYKALIKENYMKIKPNHGDLSTWAEQGVLLLNSTLTVVSGKANSHQKSSGWQEFTDFVIKTIDKNKEGVIFLLWGGFAQKKKSLIVSGNSEIIENIHPSPLAAKHGDFSHLNQFTKVNEILSKRGEKEIDWKIV